MPSHPPSPAPKATNSNRGKGQSAATHKKRKAAKLLQATQRWQATIKRLTAKGGKVAIAQATALAQAQPKAHRGNPSPKATPTTLLPSPPKGTPQWFATVQVMQNVWAIGTNSYTLTPITLTGKVIGNQVNAPILRVYIARSGGNPAQIIQAAYTPLCPAHATIIRVWF